jgi:hypothetical protein
VKVCRETFNKNHLVNNRLDKAFFGAASKQDRRKDCVFAQKCPFFL